MSGEKSSHKKRTVQDKNTEKRIDEGLFIDRIRKIAGNRKLTPWLTSLGWIANDVTRIKSGVVPGSTKLQQVSLAENVNLNWLLTGVGQRHVVEHWLNDHSIARRVTEMLSRSTGGRLIRVHEPRSHREVLVISAQPPDRDYEFFAILAGPIGSLTNAALASLAPRIVEQALIEADPELFAAISEGRVMRTELIDPVSGIQLSEGRRLSADSFRESAPPYLTFRDQLHVTVDGLSDERAQILLALLTASD